jgi:sugar phosphate isomerase/epimerase
MTMRLGISSHACAWAIGVPGYPQPARPLTVERLLQRAVELQVGVVQIADNLPLHALTEAELRTVASFAQHHRLKLEVGTQGIELGHLRKYLALAEQLSSPIVRTLLDSPERHPRANEVLEILKPVLPEYARAGVCLAIENHDRFPARVLAEILDALDSPAVGICLDTANSLGCGEGLDTLLPILGPRVVNLHVKDFRAERLPHQKGFVIGGCPTGDGLVDVPRLLTALRSHGRDPNAIVELWVSPLASLDETIAQEAAWVEKSVRCLRQWIVD